MAEAEAVVKLPEDVLMEILSRLPVKSLLRFRSVCKYWYALIRNPSFISLHLYNHSIKNNKDCLLFKRSLDNNNNNNALGDTNIGFSLVLNETPVESFDTSYFIGLNFPDDHLSFAGSINGVVCLTFTFDDSTIVLWNPAIREFRLLPKPPYQTICPSPLGFGFDLMTNDFKVVRVTKIYEFDLNKPPSDDEEGYGYFVNDASYLQYELMPVDQKVLIYELGTEDSWREVVDAIVPQDFASCRGYAVALSNGDLYWSSKETIIGFRLSDESFVQIPMPDNVYPCNNGGALHVQNDSLGLLFLAGKYDIEMGLCYDIWVMNDYGGVKEYSWTKKFSMGPLLRGLHGPLVCRENGDFVLIRWADGSMVSYNIHTREMKEYQVCGRPPVLEVVIYKESLISVKRHDN